MTLINDTWCIITCYVYNNEIRCLDSDVKKMYDSVYTCNNYIYQYKKINNQYKKHIKQLASLNDKKVALKLIYYGKR
jgi:hypothetical protein